MDTKIADEHNTQKYWDSVYEQEIGLGIDNRSDPIGYDMYMSVIKPGDRVLDFGCAKCEFLSHLTKQIPNVQAFGIDHSTVALEYGFKNNPHLMLIHDINLWPEELKTTPTFDVITAIHVVEHFEHPEKIVKDLMQFLKPGGVLVFTLPIDDQEWAEHYKIWKLEDALDLANELNMYYKIIYRQEIVIPAGFRGYKVATRLGHPNNNPIKHAIIYLRKP